MSLYADYIKETKDHTVIEDENGFYEYSLKNECLYLENIYVIPSVRGVKVAKKYIKELGQIAEKYDLPCLTGVVNVKHLNADNVLMLYLRNKASVIMADNDNIYVSIVTQDIKTL